MFLQNLFWFILGGVTSIILLKLLTLTVKFIKTSIKKNKQAKADQAEYDGINRYFTEYCKLGVKNKDKEK